MFSVEVETVESGPGLAMTSVVHILQKEDGVDRKIGSYKRNYAGFSKETFCPFLLEGRWYALYSPDYTATRVMELPSCRDLGGEEPDSNGFCPVDFHVPYAEPVLVEAGRAGTFGLVAGCVWGDDTSWKIQYLDLSGAADGRIMRKELFGYVAMPASAQRLSDCVAFHDYEPRRERISLTVETNFSLKAGQPD